MEKELTRLEEELEEYQDLARGIREDASTYTDEKKRAALTLYAQELDTLSEKHSKKISALLELIPETEIQVRMIRRLARKIGKDPDLVAHQWIPKFSARFRELWENGLRTIEEIEFHLYEKQ